MNSSLWSCALVIYQRCVKKNVLAAYCPVQVVVVRSKESEETKWSMISFAIFSTLRVPSGKASEIKCYKKLKIPQNVRKR